MMPELPVGAYVDEGEIRSGGSRRAWAGTAGRAELAWSADRRARAALQMDRAVEHHARRADGDHQPVHRADLAAGHLPRYRAQPAEPRQYQLPAVDVHGVPGGVRGAGGVVRAAG